MRPKTLEGLLNIQTHYQYIIEDMNGVTYELFEVDRHPRQLALHTMLMFGHAASIIRSADRDVFDRIPELYRVIGLRNRIAHGYEYQLEDRLIWETATQSIPTLLTDVCQILSNPPTHPTD